MKPQLERPIRGLLVADGLFHGRDLATLARAVERVELVDQQVGRARADGLPERRERGETDDTAIPAPVLPPLADWFVVDEAPRVDPAVERWRPTGCNPRSRIYRYGLGQRFAPHVDEPFRPVDGQRTFLTVLVYLPTDRPCSGGETVVADLVVPAVPGRCVVFDHRLLHEGRPVEAGEKLVIRSDVVYGTPGPDRSTPELSSIQ